jgi:hypothetical protein
MGNEILRFAQYDMALLSMTWLDLFVDEELSRSFEPCLKRKSWFGHKREEPAPMLSAQLTRAAPCDMMSYTIEV